MATDQDPPKPYRDTAATHIRALSTLNASVPTLLTTAATTFSNLTNAPIHPPTLSLSFIGPDTPSRRRAAISTTANHFFTAVLELRTALHAQIDDLEQQGVVPADEVKYRAPAAVPHQGVGQGYQAQPQAKLRDTEAKVTNNGLGGFDVGVLNARVGGRQKAGEEALGRVKTALEEMIKANGNENDERADG